MPRFADDSFDRLPAHPDRVGAHRGPRQRGRGWIVFAWAALATVLLVGAGVTYLAVVNNNIQFTDAFGGGSSTASAVATDTPTPTPTPVATTDPSIEVTVLNGTTNVGLASRVGDAATAAGWTIATMANASATDVATTTVYYSDPADEGAALGLAQLLGTAAVEQSTSFQGRITVVLGADYAGPGVTAPAV